MSLQFTSINWPKLLHKTLNWALSALLQQWFLHQQKFLFSPTTLKHLLLLFYLLYYVVPHPVVSSDLSLTADIFQITPSSWPLLDYVTYRLSSITSLNVQSVRVLTVTPDPCHVCTPTVWNVLRVLAETNYRETVWLVQYVGENSRFRTMELTVCQRTFS